VPVRAAFGYRPLAETNLIFFSLGLSQQETCNRILTELFVGTWRYRPLFILIEGQNVRASATSYYRNEINSRKTCFFGTKILRLVQDLYSFSVILCLSQICAVLGRLLG